MFVVMLRAWPEMFIGCSTLLHKNRYADTIYLHYVTKVYEFTYVAMLVSISLSYRAGDVIPMLLFGKDKTPCIYK